MFIDNDEMINNKQRQPSDLSQILQYGHNKRTMDVKCQTENAIPNRVADYS